MTNEQELYQSALEYATNIIHHATSFLAFSDAMLDYMGENFPKCKAMYNSFRLWPNSGLNLTDEMTVSNYTDEYLVEHYKRYRQEQERSRQQDFKENIDELQFLVEIYRKSDEFKKILNFVGRFHYLAPYNAMLVQMQKPGATFVFNGKDWSKYNRRPKENSQQLITLIPFGPIQCMFDYSDTEPIPGTNAVTETKLMEIWDNGLMKTKGEVDNSSMINLFYNLSIYGIYLDDSLHAANTFGGYIKVDGEHKLNVYINNDHYIKVDSRFMITINKNQSEVVRFHTLCHELGHLFCRHLYYNWDKKRDLYTKEKEFEAETVAWLVCKRHGISNPSEEYLAGYAPNGIIPICSTEYIMKAVTEIEKMMKDKVDVTKSLWYNEDKFFKDFVKDEKERIKQLKQQK